MDTDLNKLATIVSNLLVDELGGEEMSLNAPTE